MPKLIRRWKRERVSTNLSGENAAALHALASELGVPLGRIIDQALDRFFLDIEVRTERSTPPYDAEHLKDTVRKILENGDDLRPEQ